MEYKLNISEKDFNDIYFGRKKFLIRNDNIDFKIGDILILKEYENEKCTGNVMHRVITYIENNNTYLKEDFLILGIAEVSKLYT